MATRKAPSPKKSVGKRSPGKPLSKKTTTKKRVVKKSIGKKTAAKKSSGKMGVSKSVVPKKPTNKRSLKVGDIAPAFLCVNQDGKTVRLGDFAGKKNVVLYFYPRAMTPGCTAQACGVRDSASEFRHANTVVLGVSPDKVASLVKFRNRDKLNFDLLSDEDKTLAKIYSVWGMKKFMGREFMGVRRWTFIIGKDGKIKHIIEKVNTATHHDDVLAILKNI